MEYLEQLAAEPREQRRVRVPTITDPRGIDLCRYRSLKQEESWADLERRAIRAFESFGVLMTNTCINYQIVQAPVFGEHIAFGDTGSVIYANSVCGARSNFEGGALRAGRGFHPGVRRATGIISNAGVEPATSSPLEYRPSDLADWGALGAVIGQRTGSYWTVPLVLGVQSAPTSDQLKHFRRGHGQLRVGPPVPHGGCHPGGTQPPGLRRWRFSVSTWVQDHGPGRGRFLRAAGQAPGCGWTWSSWRHPSSL